MGAATRGLLVRRIKVKDLGGLVAIPTRLRSCFADGFDGQFVVANGRHRRRVSLAISSGGELIFPDWLRDSIKASASANDEVAIHLSNRPIWLVESEQGEAIAGIVARHGAASSPARAAGFTEPVQASPRLPNVDRVSEILAAAEGEGRP